MPAYDDDVDSGVRVLTVAAQPQGCLWEELLAVGVGVRVLPSDLAAIDVLLADGGIYAPIRELWRRRDSERGTSALTEGRPTIAMTTFVRMMVLKARTGWGYEVLVREVADSLHLRRFCLIGLAGRVPDESTLRKLCRRLGPDTVAALTREVIGRSAAQTGFRARAARVDSTVVEADIKFPTDAGLAVDGLALLARAGRALAGVAGAGAPRVSDRARAGKGRMRRLGRSLKRRNGEAKAEVLKITRECGELLEKSVREARRLAAHLDRGSRAQQAAGAGLAELAGRCERVCEQIAKRLAGEPISDRLVSLHDPDARPICKGKLAKRTEFGYVQQVCEVTESTRGARGYVLPPSTAPGNPGENELLPGTFAQLDALAIGIRELALDGGFRSAATADAIANCAQRPAIVYIAGSQEPESPRTRRRLYCYRSGAEGRISHLKRGYDFRRSRLKGHDGQRTWCGWATLAYNLDTHSRRIE
jgi:transposase, IS5 family